MRWSAVLQLSAVVVSALLLVQRAPAQRLERALAAAEALGARTGIAVADGEGGVLFRRRATEAFVPASNLKVLTAAALLQGLGREFRFATRFELRAGRLAVLASGDPNWITGSEHAAELVFGRVAASLRRLGIAAVRGIDLLPGTFTGPLRPAGWPQDQLHTYYCAPTGPFVLDQGTFQVAIEAAANRTRAEAQLKAPAAALPLRSALELSDRARDAVYGAQDLGDHVLVRGRFPRRSGPVTIRTAVRDPAAWYDAALGQALAGAGIAVDAAAPATADAHVHTESSALEPALRRMLEDSSNFDAEQCLRVLGAAGGDGSLAGGMAALRRQLAALFGEVPANLVLADGSGLSKDNRLTPGVLTVALFRAGPLRDALPVAGRSGTLEDRFTGTDLAGRVRAKTGWIRGASALSGVVERRDGSVRLFSILMNYDPKKNGLNKELKALQEAIVAAIDAGEADR